MEKNYYNRYWMGKIDGKLANYPPEWNPNELHRILSALKPYVRGRVLDGGCGAGFFTNEISKLPNVEKCFGIDISEDAIDFARCKYPHIDFQVSSVTDLPFESNYFDFILAIEVVEHILDVEQMFREFNRVLKNRGELAINTTDFNLLKKIIISVFFFEKYFYPTNPHIRFFTKRTLSEILKKNGFEVVTHKWNGDYFHVMPKGQTVIAMKIRDI